jgi:peptidoglycan/xylan/chitin deacetylase (PgdA/CDA1 family)
MFAWPDNKSMVFAPIVAWESWPDDLGTARSHQGRSQRPNPPGALYDRDMWVVYDHEYAEHQGLPRLLDLFGHYGVKATFVASGLRVQRSPDLAREAQRRGHDMASENFVHEYPIMYTREQERKSLADTVAAFRAVLGVPPSGYISPGHRPSPNTVPLLFELGYEWDADFQNDDMPFLIETRERTMVGMPYAHLSDYHLYQTHGRTPRQMLEMLWDEFRVLRREGVAGRPRIMGYAIHPFLCHGFRTVVIEEFLKGLKDYPDVWIATRKEIADWIRSHPGDLPRCTLDEVVAAFPPT